MLVPNDKYIRRSLLFVPANRPELALKAKDSIADTLILDLEDSVPTEEKDSARDQLVKTLTEVDFSSKKICVRTNGSPTSFAVDDWRALLPFLDKIDAIILPKLEKRQEIILANYHLDNQNFPLWGILETPKGIEKAAEIFQGVSSLKGIIYGNNDYSSEVGIPVGDWKAHEHARQVVINKARAAGLMVFDGPSPLLLDNTKDLAFFLEESRRSREIGFDGKCAIHPKQLEHINQTFQPTPEEITHAERVIESTAQGGAARVDGEMVELLHRRAARNLLELRDLILTRDASRVRYS